MLDTKIATVDYIKDDVCGGVQTVLDNFKLVSDKVRYFSKNDIVRHIPSKGFQHTVVSGLLDDIVHDYEKFCGCELVVKNSVVGTYRKHHVPMVSILQDNNLEGPRKLLESGMYNILDYNMYRYDFRLLQQSTLEKSDLVVSVSRDIADKYKDFYGLDSVVIPNGIDHRLWIPAKPGEKQETRAELDIPAGAKVGISVQKFHPIKGFHLMTRLARDRPDIYWIIVMSHENVFKKNIRLSNVRVLNSCSPDTLRRLYIASDFCIQPSAVESFGLVPVEAMSCDVPVIVSDTGIFKRGGPSVTGFGAVVDDWTYDAFSGAVDKMLSGDFVFKPRDYVLNNGLTLDKWTDSWRHLIKKLV